MYRPDKSLLSDLSYCRRWTPIATIILSLVVTLVVPLNVSLTSPTCSSADDGAGANGDAATTIVTEAFPVMRLKDLDSCNSVKV